MQVLRDRKAICQLADPELRALLQRRVDALAEFEDYELHELVTFIVVEPEDPLLAVDSHLGFPILSNRLDGTRFGQPGFKPSFDLLAKHPGWYEIVFVLSDDGYGVELFVPDDESVDAGLLAMCAKYAVSSDLDFDT